MENLAIMLLGLGGAGKTTASRALVNTLHRLGYHPQLVEFDTLRQRLAPAGADPFSADPAIKDVIYGRAIEEFNRILASGDSLVIEGGLSSERIRTRLKREVAGLKIVYVECPLWLAALRDTKRSLTRTPHPRGWFLYLRAMCDRLNPFRVRTAWFPQPGVTYPFEHPACADLRVNSLGRSPVDIAAEIVRGLSIPGRSVLLPAVVARLTRGAEILSLISRKRLESGCCELGRSVEDKIIQAELDDLSQQP